MGKLYNFSEIWSFKWKINKRDTCGGNWLVLHSTTRSEFNIEIYEISNNNIMFLESKMLLTKTNIACRRTSQVFSSSSEWIQLAKNIMFQLRISLEASLYLLFAYTLASCRHTSSTYSVSSVNLLLVVAPSTCLVARARITIHTVDSTHQLGVMLCEEK